MVQSGAAVQAEHCAVTQPSLSFLPARATFNNLLLDLAIPPQTNRRLFAYHANIGILTKPLGNGSSPA